MSASKEYMMLLRNTDWDLGLSIEDTERIIGEYTEWFERLANKGILTGGKPLLGASRIISAGEDRVSDGPFIESKEAIGGFISIKAANFDEAAGIARTFPPISVGVEVELREYTDLCPVSQRLEKRVAATESSIPA